MNIYTKKIEKSLDLFLTVTQRSLTVDSYQPSSGDSYRLVFDRDENPDDIAKRIGYEVLSWFSLMEEEFDEQDDD